MARKKTATKKAATKGAQAQLPKGFTAIESGFSKSWPSEDTAIGDAISGIVTGYRDVPRPKSKGGDTQVMSIELDDGSTVSVWKSAVLKPLFEEDYTDVAVWIRYDGLGKKKKGQNAARLYTIAYH